MNKKPIEGFVNNWVHRDGYVSKKYKGEIRTLRSIQHRDGRFRTVLCDGRINKDKPNDLNLDIVKLPHLVAKYFCSNPNNYQHIKFKDNDYRNNSASNLEWISAEEYDRIRKSYKGETLYHIPNFPEYYITETKKIISVKSNYLNIMNPSNKKYNMYTLTDFNTDQKTLTIDDIWEMADKGDDFSRKEHEKWLKKYRDKVSLIKSNGKRSKIKKVKCLQDNCCGNKIYHSITECASAHSCARSSIIYHTSGKANKQKFKFAENN
ncbi:hypothetical protein NC796_07480 [Aliifodinibius sp. S!AR15-10]|uniref:hypothetical protein n=1 Tax=Aliifodinibius sp. S!AR15-10 TaxID=2950437 RepID=UPI00285CB83B|nr:hypothetical protein [Aliifodinibius sp. S!AR15-10]MDR8390973.1 hypothetical protein [Aliifodinibius sp. S!AR15-10]